MKRIIAIGFIIFSAFSAFSQIKVACIGNSITYGRGYDNPQSYPSQLDSMLGNGWEVRNFGVPGATMLRKGDMAYHKLKAYTDARALNPDVVIIKLGTNDSKPQNWQYSNDFITDYDSMLTELKALPSKPYIFICTPVPAYSHGWGIRDSIIQAEIPLLEQIAKENKLPLVNLYNPLTDRAAWFPDGIHPNEYGLAQIASVVAEEIKEKESMIRNRPK